MKPYRSTPSVALAALFAAPLFALFAFSCSSKNSTSSSTSSSSGTTGTETTVEKDGYCEACTISPTAVPSTCKSPRGVNACCACVATPTQPLVRGTGLNRYSSNDANVNLGCLDDPGVVGTPKTITLKGNVRVFSSGNDSQGVKIEIFKEGANGALGEAVGTAVITTNDDKDAKKEDWLKKCPDGGCTYRAYTYPGVPTETRLIVKTSDAQGGSQWASFFDYNILFRNEEVTAGDLFVYEPSAVAATDINTVASAAGGFTVKPDKGLLAGEVHDCGDVRLSGATVDIDAAHEGDMFYFGENEADPLPDKSRGSLGTSKLGLFGTLNVTTGVPIRLSAIGKSNNQTVLLGTYTVQTFPGAVTALRLRGRRPWQK